MEWNLISYSLALSMDSDRGENKEDEEVANTSHSSEEMEEEEEHSTTCSDVEAEPEHPERKGLLSYLKQLR